jgi:hypothetical protein
MAGFTGPDGSGTRISVAEVGLDHGGHGVPGHQGAGAHDHHRVVIDVDDTDVRMSFPRPLVRVRAGGQPGAEIRLGAVDRA